jgi:hypothetical protein
MKNQPAKGGTHLFYHMVVLVLFPSQVIMNGKVSAVDVSIYLASEMKMLGRFALGFLG